MDMTQSIQQKRKSSRLDGNETTTFKKNYKNQFYKTTFCQFVKEFGTCHRGNNCSFAHTQEELRNEPDLKKTSMCQEFQNGNCVNGDRCAYAHSADELSVSVDCFYKSKKCSFYRRGRCQSGQYCRFLHTGKTRKKSPGPGAPHQDVEIQKAALNLVDLSGGSGSSTDVGSESMYFKDSESDRRRNHYSVSSGHSNYEHYDPSSPTHNNILSPHHNQGERRRICPAFVTPIQTEFKQKPTMLDLIASPNSIAEPGMIPPYLYSRSNMYQQSPGRGPINLMVTETNGQSRCVQEHNYGYNDVHGFPSASGRKMTESSEGQITEERHSSTSIQDYEHLIGKLSQVSHDDNKERDSKTYDKVTITDLINAMPSFYEE